MFNLPSPSPQFGNFNPLCGMPPYMMNPWQNSALLRGMANNAAMFQSKNGFGGSFPGNFPFMNASKTMDAMTPQSSIFSQYQNLLALMSAAASNLNSAQYNFPYSAPQCRPRDGLEPNLLQSKNISTTDAHSASVDSPEISVSPSGLSGSGESPQSKPGKTETGSHLSRFRPYMDQMTTKGRFIEPKQEVEESSDVCQVSSPEVVTIKIEGGQHSSQFQRFGFFCDTHFITVFGEKIVFVDFSVYCFRIIIYFIFEKAFEKLS